MLLSLIVFLPLAGALVVLLAGGRGDQPDRAPLVRNIALLTSLVTFAATLYLWWRFDPAGCPQKSSPTRSCAGQLRNC